MIHGILFIMAMLICLGCLSATVYMTYEGWAMGDVYLASFGILTTILVMFFTGFMVQVEHYHRKMLGYWPFNR